MEDSVAHWPVCSRHSARRRICFRKCIDAIITGSGNRIDDDVKATALSLLRRAQNWKSFEFFYMQAIPIGCIFEAFIFF